MNSPGLSWLLVMSYIQATLECNAIHRGGKMMAALEYREAIVRVRCSDATNVLAIRHIN